MEVGSKEYMKRFDNEKLVKANEIQRKIDNKISEFTILRWRVKDRKISEDSKKSINDIIDEREIEDIKNLVNELNNLFK